MAEGHEIRPKAMDPDRLADLKSFSELAMKQQVICRSITELHELLCHLASREEEITELKAAIREVHGLIKALRVDVQRAMD